MGSKLSNKYRLVLLDDDTLGEINSTRLSLLSMLAFVATLVCLVAISTYLLFSYTPLRYMIPGYADVNNNKEYITLLSKVEDIETELDAQRIYTEGIKNMLNPSKLKIDNLDGNIEDNNENQLSGNLPVEHFYFYSPLKGEISAGFDLNENHLGTDIVAEKGTPIRSIQDGVVINADWSAKTGNTISIQHRSNLVSVYKHNSTLLSKIGEKVGSGEAIAIIGNTGELTSGPHVHLELWKNGVPIDPAKYIVFD